MKLKEIITDKICLWSIRLILISVAGILLIFFYIKIVQAYHTTKLMNQLGRATEEYVDYELSNITY